jgi:hypothetical protein
LPLNLGEPFLNGSSIKLMSAPRPVRWIGEGYGSPLPTNQSFEIAAFKGITAQDAMATEKPQIAEVAESWPCRNADRDWRSRDAGKHYRELAHWLRGIAAKCRLPCTQRVSHGLALRKSDWQKIPMRKARQAVLELAGREVVITNPDKPFFPQAGHTKLHLVRYYAAGAEGALRGIAGRPIVLKRYVDGAAGEPFF